MKPILHVAGAYLPGGLVTDMAYGEVEAAAATYTGPDGLKMTSSL
jgi:hypothetical protein